MLPVIIAFLIGMGCLMFGFIAKKIIFILISIFLFIYVIFNSECLVNYILLTVI